MRCLEFPACEKNDPGLQILQNTRIVSCEAICRRRLHGSTTQSGSLVGAGGCLLESPREELLCLATGVSRRSRIMHIGFDVRTPAAVEDPNKLTQLVTEGEALGFDYVTISDHLVIRPSLQAKYPSSEGSDFPAVAYGRCHEQLTAIAFLAAKTCKLRFVTSVMVVPYRPPVMAAKMISTIDILSGGRLTVGVGTGWIKDEFEAVDAPNFAERGRVTDEYLEAMRTLWTDVAPSYQGEHVRFSGIAFEPKPAQEPHPPLWVGGMSGPAMRRAARLGDAWYPMLNDQSKPLDSLERLRAGISRMRALAEAAGREPGSVAVAMRVAMHGDQLVPQASDGGRRLFSGSGADLAADLRSLRDLGIIAVDFRFGHSTAEQALQEMEAFQQDVVATM
jgi:probable F420-dependent oxidoreductase